VDPGPAAPECRRARALPPSPCARTSPATDLRAADIAGGQPVSGVRSGTEAHPNPDPAVGIQPRRTALCADVADVPADTRVDPSVRADARVRVRVRGVSDLRPRGRGPGAGVVGQPRPSGRARVSPC